MQPKYRIEYSDAAILDVDEMFSYIAEDNIAAAEIMAEKLDVSIRRLIEYPEMGAMLNEDDFVLVKSGYRFIVVKPYLMFYRIINDRIVIYRILHGRRDYLRELFD